MPASVLHDMPGQCFSGQNSVEELRAMQQVAMELSMLSLADSSEASNGMGVINSNSQFLEDTLNGNPMDNHFKGSSNTTECVPVPSSEHVAEIVGRQGCKIKALRAKTNTYIKTPVRGLEPVFVVTGRRQDVRNAKQEIMSAAEHFSQIRASRRQNAVPNNDSGICPPSPNSPGQVTIQVRVPYRVVGLVVGPKGATIKRIQQSTHTYIVTPSRDKEPVFEVMGTVECVEKARKEIESHIAMRTGGVPNNSGQLGGSHHIMDSGGDNSVGGAISDFQISGIDSGFNDLTASAFGSASSLLQSQQQHSSLHSAGMVNQRNTFSSSALGSNQDNMFTFPSSNINSSMVCTEKMMSGAGSNRSNGIGSSFSAFTATANNSTGSGFMSSNGMGAPSSTQFGLYDSSDEGIGSPSYGSDMASLCSTTPSLWSDGLGSSSGSGQHPLSGLYGPNKPPNTLPLGSRRSNSLDECTAPRMSPTVDGSGLTDHSSVRRICSDPRTGDASLAAFELTAGGTSGGVNTGLTGLLSRDVSLTGGSTSGCSSASSSPVDLLPRGIGAPSHNFPTPPSSRMTPPTLARMTPPPQMARMTPPPLLARMTPPPLARGTTPPMSARSAPMSARSATPSGPSPARTPPQACNACNESPVAAALVPCGHNSFCLDCANQVVNKPAPHERCCPICMQPATQAVRIIS